MCQGLRSSGSSREANVSGGEGVREQQKEMGSKLTGAWPLSLVLMALCHSRENPCIPWPQAPERT